ncbi:hypothetical protein RF55_21161 [Lasius niger]|uniref:Uncharacterized protein n=1 Tax=Lasius niger TaxID=67767 RepID=A0A0J7JXW5_LASNI|nr:hypothetical protein RF55_21161 [Lasius niger]
MVGHAALGTLRHPCLEYGNHCHLSVLPRVFGRSKYSRHCSHILRYSSSLTISFICLERTPFSSSLNPFNHMYILFLIGAMNLKGGILAKSIAALLDTVCLDKLQINFCASYSRI